MKLYRDVRTHVYALAYKAEMFYPFDSTQSRNESGSERFKNKKGIFHSNNGRYPGVAAGGEMRAVAAV